MLSESLDRRSHALIDHPFFHWQFCIFFQEGDRLFRYYKMLKNFDQRLLRWILDTLSHDVTFIEIVHVRMFTRWNFTFGFTWDGFKVLCKRSHYLFVTFNRFSIHTLNNRQQWFLVFCLLMCQINFNFSMYCLKSCSILWCFMGVIYWFSSSYTYRFISVVVLILIVKVYSFFSLLKTKGFISPLGCWSEAYHHKSFVRNFTQLLTAISILGSSWANVAQSYALMKFLTSLVLSMFFNLLYFRRVFCFMVIRWKFRYLTYIAWFVVDVVDASACMQALYSDLQTD